MFYFQYLLNQGLAGIDRTVIIPTVTGIAYTVLLIGFLVGLYQAAMRGGDLQALGIAAIKYLVVAIILANWSSIFREVNDSFTQLAQFISNSSGAGDMFLSWMDQLKQQFDANGALSLWPLVTGEAASMISVLLIVVAYLLYAAAVIVFGFLYTLFGCVLYVLGPLVLSLMPIAGVGQLAKSYAVNVMIWNAWGILYAIFGALITAIQANRISNLLSFMGFFTGPLDSTMLGLISIFYALALLVIPFIAKRVISGDVGLTAYVLVRTATAAAGAAIAAGAGFAAGIGAGSGAIGGSTTSAARAEGLSAAVTAPSSSTPPPEPSLSSMIRSGIMSAVGATAPAVSVARTQSDPGATAGGSSSVSTRRDGSGNFRPLGLVQTMAFHTARFAGDAVRIATTSTSPQQAEPLGIDHRG